MAYPATYSQSELAGSGILLKDNMNTTPGSSYRFDITNKDVTGACYLFLYSRLHNSSIPQYFNGSTITSKQNCGGEIILPYQVSIVIFKEGNSRLFLNLGLLAFFYLFLCWFFLLDLVLPKNQTVHV